MAGAQEAPRRRALVVTRSSCRRTFGRRTLGPRRRSPVAVTATAAVAAAARTRLGWCGRTAGQTRVDEALWLTRAPKEAIARLHSVDLAMKARHAEMPTQLSWLLMKLLFAYRVHNQLHHCFVLFFRFASRRYSSSRARASTSWSCALCGRRCRRPSTTTATAARRHGGGRSWTACGRSRDRRHAGRCRSPSSAAVLAVPQVLQRREGEGTGERAGGSGGGG